MPPPPIPQLSDDPGVVTKTEGVAISFVFPAASRLHIYKQKVSFCGWGGAALCAVARASWGRALRTAAGRRCLLGVFKSRRTSRIFPELRDLRRRGHGVM